MSKINELVYDVIEAVKAFSDDSELEERYIIYLYNIKRAKYLRQDLNNYLRTVDNSVQQTLCLDMELVDATDCSVDYSCSKILKSVKPLPKPIDLHSKVAISKVKPVTKLGIPFNFISKDKAPYIENAPFNKALYAFIDVDNHIYVYSKAEEYSLVECLSVTGVFENPLDLIGYFNCCGCEENETTTCYNIDESEYPLQPHYIDVIREEIIRDILRTKQIPEDKVNDSTD